MTYINNLYTKDIIINDCLKLVFSNTESYPLLSEQNIIFIAGFTGSGKSTLIRRLVQNLNCFSEIPERRFITLKGIIEPFVSYFNLKCDFNKRQDRIDIVKNYKKNIPEGIVFVLRHIRVIKDLPKGFIFDGIRGDEELKIVLETFKKAQIIILNASKETRLNRIVERKDTYDQINIAPTDTASKIIENDHKLHGNLNKSNSKRVININTEEMDQDEVFLTAYNWILNNNNNNCK